MVAILKTSNSIRRTFHYNELKVKSGMAECIMAANYPIDLEVLNEQQRLNRLLKLAALNENVKRNSVHISLNFTPEEQLSKERLCEVAFIYMERIGFGNQPYLVYQHHDAAHNHIHIVTVKVRANGSRIDMHNLCRNLSEPARKEIEKQFKLVIAEDHKRQVFQLGNIQKAVYGKSETIKAIASVLDAVLLQYKYTSLAELNTILNQYNVAADRGSENSRTYQNHGLMYRILDEHGNKVGVPFKASLINSKPTLSFLENRFTFNENERKKYAARIKNCIDLAFLKQSDLSLNDLIEMLKKEGIHTALRQNKEGILYEITYVDHRTKCVFNGNDLSKQYSAAGIVERTAAKEVNFLQPSRSMINTSDNFQAGKQQQTGNEFTSNDNWNNSIINRESRRLSEVLFQTDSSGNYLPNSLKRIKKRRRKSLSNH
ncbi:relaxase/mobilization nuclease domain-containing protein [Solitalea lacus]|uniref:relaxase/mobilization nuclease domain-containing protein n=1 Tax=Solitalea lacus TaxID=2911172 RepID=UPI001EDC2011|nr:relaxase/mobilization nuclease domain-containing protein [Solitalea lacus]UKJ09200.1 relaxase/mobilization nuclease domain-containing protein [Solitalea lacus]